MKTTTQKLARAFKDGFRAAYGKEMRHSIRQTFMETLDDMAIALTKKAVDEQSEEYSHSSWILGDILDAIDESYRKPKKKRGRPYAS